MTRAAAALFAAIATDAHDAWMLVKSQTPNDDGVAAGLAGVAALVARIGATADRAIEACAAGEVRIQFSEEWIFGPSVLDALQAIKSTKKNTKGAAA